MRDSKLNKCLSSLILTPSLAPCLVLHLVMLWFPPALLLCRSWSVGWPSSHINTTTTPPPLTILTSRHSSQLLSSISGLSSLSTDQIYQQERRKTGDFLMWSEWWWQNTGETVNLTKVSTPAKMIWRMETMTNCLRRGTGLFVLLTALIILTGRSRAGEFRFL